MMIGMHYSTAHATEQMHFHIAHLYILFMREIGAALLDLTSPNPDLSTLLFPLLLSINFHVQLALVVSTCLRSSSEPSILTVLKEPLTPNSPIHVF